MPEPEPVSEPQPASEPSIATAVEDPPPPPAPAPGSDAPLPSEPPSPAPHGVIETKIGALEAMMARVLASGDRRPTYLQPTEAPDPDHDALSAIHAALLDNEVPPGCADRIAREVRTALDAATLDDRARVEDAVLERLAAAITTTTSIASGADTTRGVVALIGPTGVGKTTTVAKLAARAKLREGRSVGLITSDTYRIGAVEQLRTYAEIVGLTLKIANTPEQMRRAIDELDACDLIVLDTAGRSPNNTARLDELHALLRAADPTETHLVCSTTVSARVLGSSAQRFSALRPDRVILTKLDECVTTGLLTRIDELVGLPISFVTLGQEVPDDLEPACAQRLARTIMGDAPA